VGDVTAAAHGTRSRYVHDGCRCEPCTVANRRYQGARIAKPTRAKLLGVDDAEYAQLLDLQDGHCALCPAVPRRKRFHADHDHGTDAVRGLLCHRCNRNLPSWVKPLWLVKAALYLLRDAPEPTDDHELRSAVIALYEKVV
jgi:hypothetical protein